MISIMRRLGVAAALWVALVPGAEATPGICAFVFSDANGNGQQDQGEGFIPDWEVCVTDSNGREDCRWTSADGAACWFLLPEGDYMVCEGVRGGWYNTTPICVERNIGHEVAQVFFGNREGAGPDRVQLPAEVDQDGPEAALVLAQNAPNPVGPATTIRFSLPEAGVTLLSIVDVGGRVVREIAGGELAAGTHGFEWNGTDERGERLAGGVYFYRLAVGGRVETKRMLLLP
jgi:hypothetical protein